MVLKHCVFDNKKLMVEWDYDKNTGIDPKKLTLDSKKKVWWKCPTCDHRHYCSVQWQIDGYVCINCAEKRLEKHLDEVCNDLFDGDYDEFAKFL